jgi:hypothetical protein
MMCRRGELAEVSSRLLMALTLDLYINQQSHVCRSLNKLQHTRIGLISSIQPSLYKYIRTLSVG